MLEYRGLYSNNVDFDEKNLKIVHLILCWKEFLQGCGRPAEDLRTIGLKTRTKIRHSTKEAVDRQRTCGRSDRYPEGVWRSSVMRPTGRGAADDRTDIQLKTGDQGRSGRLAEDLRTIGRMISG